MKFWFRVLAVLIGIESRQLEKEILFWLRDLRGGSSFFYDDGFWVSSMKPVSQTRKKLSLVHHIPSFKKREGNMRPQTSKQLLVTWREQGALLCNTDFP